MTRILITEPINEIGYQILEKVGEIIIIDSHDKQRVHSELLFADVLLVKYFYTSREVIDTAKNLKIIAKHGVGVDTIDVDYATDLGILVLNAPTGNTTSVIEFTWGLILSLLRNIHQARLTKSCKHQESKFLWGMEMAGKTLGIIGLGTIGAGIARIGQAFNMQILAYDPFIEKPPADLSTTRLLSIDSLLESSHILVIAAPLTPHTYHMITNKELKRMPIGSFLVNTSRGGLVDESALLRSLLNGQLAGAALDVVENEPIKKDHPLLDLPNVIITPHLASGTHDAQRKVAQEICTDITRVLEGLMPLHPVNPISKAHRINSLKKRKTS